MRDDERRQGTASSEQTRGRFLGKFLSPMCKSTCHGKHFRKFLKPFHHDKFLIIFREMYVCPKRGETIRTDRSRQHSSRSGRHPGVVLKNTSRRKAPTLSPPRGEGVEVEGVAWPNAAEGEGRGTTA